MNQMNNNPRRRRRKKLTRKQKIMRKIRRNLPVIAIVLLVLILAIYGWLIFKIIKSLNSQPKEILIFHSAEEIAQLDTMKTELYELMQCEWPEDTELEAEETTLFAIEPIAIDVETEVEVTEVATYVTDSSVGFPEYANEVQLLAKVIQIEAGSTIEDKIYVGSVMINRARTNYRDFRSVNTISEVLYQKNPQQYAEITLRKIETCIPSEECIEVAQGLIDGSIECLDESILFQLTKKQSWVIGQLEDVILEGAKQYYGRPLDFEEGCK